jgi:prevent-host-death family protein
VLFAGSDLLDQKGLYDYNGHIGGSDMKALSLADAKTRFSEIVTSAEHEKERVVIEKRHKPVAVVIGYDDYKKLEALEDIYESRLLEETIKTGKFYSLEEVAKRVKVEL